MLLRRLRLTVVAVATLVAIAAAQQNRSVVPGGRVVTPAANTGSRSIVLRSTHILLLEVIDARPGEWAPSRPGFKARLVDVSLRVAETLRGQLDPPPGGPISISVTQFEYAGELMMQPLPGAWSRVDLSPGTALAAFAQTESVRVQQVLTEPACTRVTEAAPVVAGLRIASRSERNDLALTETLTLAAPHAGQLDPDFAEFLWARYGARALAAQSEFNLLATFAENKGLEDSTRQALIKGGYDAVKLEGDDLPERAQRLALTMFRVLLMPDASDLHENLIETYLPNLLGITSGLPHQSPSGVFKGHEAERDRVRAFLRQYGTDADAAQLLQWLNRI